MNIDKYAYIIMHMTPRRLCNVCLLKLEKMLSKTKLRSKPIILSIDVTNRCNLHCRNCFAEKHRKRHKTGFMQLSDFKRIIDKTRDYALVLNLYLWGEPFLNKDIFKMIRYAEENGIYTKISSNMNICYKGFPEKLISSGLKELRINIPTFNKTKYRRYTRTGNLDIVKKNIKSVSSLKKGVGIRHPLLELLFLASEKNHKEPFLQENKPDAWGADALTIKLLQPVRNNRVLEREFFRKIYRDYMGAGKKCRWLWEGMVVNFNGTTEPCCAVYYHLRGSSILLEELDNVRNSRELVSLRREFVNGSENTICRRCDTFRFYHHLPDKDK